MNALATETETTKTASRWTAATGWLLAPPRGRRATGRGRFIRILLTVSLLVTGVLAWAVALVQPWANRTGQDAQTMAAVLDTQKMQAITADLDAVCAEELPAAPAPGATRLPRRRRPAP